MRSEGGGRLHTRARESRPTPGEAEQGTGPATDTVEARKGNRSGRVLVLGSDGKPLDPCGPKRARKLLAQGRAVRAGYQPFTIRLRDRKRGDSRTEVQRHEVRVDPGIATSAVALVMVLAHEERVVYQEELHHRTDISRGLHTRKAYRRRRRGEKRYRAPRFDNRKNKGLPPSLESVCANLEHRVKRLAARSPVTEACVETAKFDTHAMQRPGVQGEEYQRGTLHGTHERAYVRARDGGRCRYCDRASWQGTVRFTLDHVVPRARGGSSRPSNLVWACLPCNQAKGSRTVEELLRDDPARLADLARQRKAPLAAAPKMGWVCQELVRRLGETLQVRTTTGADTAWARRRWGIAKSHADDAACTGSTRPVHGLRTPAVLRAQGHGRRQQAKASKGEAYRQ